MKKYALEVIKRGLMAAAGGPVVLAIVYGILGAAGTIESLSPGEVCMGILTVTLMAFIASGCTVVYTIESLPLMSAILIHAGVIYLDYLVIYLLNRWVPRNLGGIGIFTAIFAAGYAVTWLFIYLSIKAKTDRINKQLWGEKK